MKRFWNIIKVPLTVGMIAVLLALMVRPEDPPKTKKDTVKIDTLSIKQQQVIIRKKTVQQQSKLDSMIKNKKEKK